MNIVKSSGSSIAGNVNTSITVDSDETRAVLYGQVVLTTDATVANRRVIFRILDDASNVIIDIHSGAVVAASQTDQHHEMMPGIFRETTFVGSALQVPIPTKCVVSPGYSVQIAIENGVAGDSYDYAFLSERTKVAKGSVIVAE